MKDINKCCKKLPTIIPCLGSVADGSCKTSSDCKSGYTCKLGSCCKDNIISIPTTCPLSMSTGTCNSDTDCKTGYKCESGMCCRSLSTLPRCPVGTVSSGSCTGGRKCGGECVDTLCCEKITDIEIGGGSSPKFSEYQNIPNIQATSLNSHIFLFLPVLFKCNNSRRK